MTNHSEEPYIGKRDPRLDTEETEQRTHCPACGEKPCACGDVVDRALGTKRPGPHITPADIDMEIATAKAIQYHRFPYTTVTVCCVTLSNGFSVVGKSAAVSSENYDFEIGCRVAREDAENQLWELLGFRLKQALFEGAKPDENRI